VHFRSLPTGRPGNLAAFTPEGSTSGVRWSSGCRGTTPLLTPLTHGQVSARVGSVGRYVNSLEDETPRSLVVQRRGSTRCGVGAPGRYQCSALPPTGRAPWPVGVFVRQRRSSPNARFDTTLTIAALGTGTPRSGLSKVTTE
jgi:hypothetical protein